MKLNSFRVAVVTRPGVLTWANACYSRAKGVDKVRVIHEMTRSDTFDSCGIEFSDDNGVTWHGRREEPASEARSTGVFRIIRRQGVVDPNQDLFLSVYNEGLLPTDNPKEGMKQWYLRYEVSRDGGKTAAVNEQVVQNGFYPEHPLDGVWVGRNSAMIGDFTCKPIFLKKTGRILAPFQASGLGPTFEYHNPSGALTFHQAGVLHGEWRNDGRVEWVTSRQVGLSPDRSTRGAIEPTLMEFDDGRVLMVCRGSNDVSPWLEGRRWYSVSEDGGLTWSRFETWRWKGGDAFFSPSSCSQLIRHSSGKVFWFGNISPENTRGNLPRRPMTCVEVCQETLMLKKETLFVADDRRPTDDEGVLLSNFSVHEDRVTGELVLNMSRLFADKPRDWTSDSYEYRLTV
jgi:hypothetical protein